MSQKKMPFVVRLFVYLLILAVVVLLSTLWYWNGLKAPVNLNGEPKAFVIQQGESVDSIANRLEKEGLIKFNLAFKITLKLNGDSSHIEAGDYKLSPAMSVEELIQNLNHGALDRWVTLLEGWRVEQVAKQLHEQLGVKEDEFVRIAKSKEGHLFPDTYLFNKSVSSQDIASTLENTFNQKYNADLQNQVKSKGLTAEQGIVLASIVEREGRSDQVRQNVASILLKRLKMGMPLQADATVQYAKDSQTLKSGQTPQKFWQPVIQEDYKNIISAYNTYLSPGLSPGPICNPSLSSIKAVASADASIPYLYYYVDSNGKIYYAQTLDEHNQNIASHR